MRFLRIYLFCHLCLLSFNHDALASGDCDGNGVVTISEVQSAINTFLGLKLPIPCVDEDQSGVVSISEVQKTINTFLGLTPANTPPVANAGKARSVAIGSLVTLDGSASSDANADLLTFAWSFTSKPSGSSANLSSTTAAKPTFNADVAGVYTFNLVVFDGKTNSAATVAVTATDTTPATTGQMGGAIQGKALALTGVISTFATVTNYTNGITTDGSSLFFTLGSSICKADIFTGVITTIAGVANADGAADGTGTDARFNSPYDITVVGTNLFVLDGNSNTIRKVEILSGKVTTIAGTAGISGHTDGIGSVATFNEPFGLTTDGVNLYVVDGSIIRKVEILTGKVSTIAGTANSYGHNDGIGAAATFGTPLGITTDGTNLYVTDNTTLWNGALPDYRGTIRKIVISTGEVTTLAGSPTVSGSTDGRGTAASFHELCGITSDGINLFVSDRTVKTIRKISLSTGEVSTIPGTTATLSYSAGITTDGTNLYIADTAIYKLN